MPCSTENSKTISDWNGLLFQKTLFIIISENADYDTIRLIFIIISDPPVCPLQQCYNSPTRWRYSLSTSILSRMLCNYTHRLWPSRVSETLHVLYCVYIRVSTCLSAFHNYGGWINTAQWCHRRTKRYVTTLIDCGLLGYPRPCTCCAACI